MDMKTKSWSLDGQAYLGDIFVDIPIELEYVESLEIKEKMGCHATATIKAVLGKEESHGSIQKINKDTVVSIVAKNPEEKAIFCGIPKKISIKHENKVHYLYLDLYSLSKKMDIEIKSRSFQDKEKLYENLYKEILKEYDGDVLDSVTESRALEAPIIQYKETDWEFLRRIASHLEAPIYPHIKQPKIQMYLGINKADKYISANFNYTIEKDIYTYKNYTSNFESWRELDQTKYITQSKEEYQLGDKISHADIVLTLGEKTTTLVDSVLTYTYTLQKESGLRQPKYYNEHIKGSSIKGKVLEVENDKVKLHLEIDEEQEVSTAHFYKFDTSYTTEGSTGWYIMPQVGDEAYLYQPIRNDSESYVKRIERTDGKDNKKTKDPSTKYLGTIHGNELKMSPTELIFHEKESMYIKMTDTEGIEIRSPKDIEFTSSQIRFDAKEISVEAKKNIQLITEGANILMGEKMHLKG